MPQYKVYYFPINGRSGFIKLLLSHAGADFAIENVSF